jgi:hypothetical protein
VTVAGAFFVVLFVAGGLLFGDLLGSSGDSDATFDAYFADATNRARDIIGGYALAASGMALAWFSLELRRTLRIANAECSLPDVAGAGGVLAGVLIVVAAAALMTVSFSTAFGRGFGDTGQFATGAAGPPQFGYVLLCVLAVIPASGMIVAASLAAMRARRMPAWAGVAGIALATFLLLSLFVTPLVALPIWVALATWTLRDAPSRHT